VLAGEIQLEEIDTDPYKDRFKASPFVGAAAKD
jgi:hypothetical protein